MAGCLKWGFHLFPGYRIVEITLRVKLTRLTMDWWKTILLLFGGGGKLEKCAWKTVEIREIECIEGCFSGTFFADNHPWRLDSWAPSKWHVLAASTKSALLIAHSDTSEQWWLMLVCSGVNFLPNGEAWVVLMFSKKQQVCQGEKNRNLARNKTSRRHPAKQPARDTFWAKPFSIVESHQRTQPKRSADD